MASRMPDAKDVKKYKKKQNNDNNLVWPVQMHSNSFNLAHPNAHVPQCQSAKVPQLQGGKEQLKCTRSHGALTFRHLGILTKLKYWNEFDEVTLE